MLLIRRNKLWLVSVAQCIFKFAFVFWSILIWLNKMHIHMEVSAHTKIHIYIYITFGNTTSAHHKSWPWTRRRMRAEIFLFSVVDDIADEGCGWWWSGGRKCRAGCVVLRSAFRIYSFSSRSAAEFQPGIRRSRALCVICFADLISG